MPDLPSLGLRTGALDLPDGRQLGWTEHGPTDGAPVLYLHGGNDCGLELGWFADTLAPGLRVIAPDRPGFGDSTHQVGRRLLDLVPDVERLLDHLGVDRLPVIGLSGGGPHALALAAGSRRISAVAAVASPCPLVGVRLRGLWFPIRLAYALARHAPDWLLVRFQRAMNDAERNMAYAERMPAPDAALLREDPSRKQRVIASVTRAHAQGYAGAAHEWRLYVREWGFEPSAIAVPTMLWYGDADPMAPAWMGRRLAAEIPGAQLQVLDGEAHLSIIHRHARRMIDALLARAADDGVRLAVK